MNLLYQSAFLKALGWALLSSLWQMALLWLVYRAFTMGGKKVAIPSTTRDCVIITGRRLALVPDNPGC